MFRFNFFTVYFIILFHVSGTLVNIMKVDSRETQFEHTFSLKASLYTNWYIIKYWLKSRYYVQRFFKNRSRCIM
jgi:hypothetical protein